jgi:phosphotransferase system, enzyme I, PtsP
LSQTASGSPKTADGVTVELYANINLLSDATVAGQMRASGVGLYRTEFPFLIRGDFPSEEEQFVIYKKLVSLVPDKEITIRTLDIGGDKVLSYYDSGKENNPFLGIRSIRFSLKHKEIFHQQIRAILRAGAGAQVRMMFPMISSLDEFLEAKSEVAFCQRSLEESGIPHNKQMSLGVMIELPSVLEIIDELAAEADFFSIGTNDFIQYLLAVDRTNEKVADLYLPYHPSVLRAIKKVIVAAGSAGKEVSVCGDMAHEEKFIPLLLGMGVRKLSVDPFFLPRTRQFILSRNLRADEAMAAEVLKAKEIKTIAEILGLAS